MFWVSKVFAPMALVVGIAAAMVVTGDAGAQPPFGKGGFQPGKKFDKKGDDRKFEEKKKDDKKFEGKKGPAPKSDAVVDAWVKVLIEKITDPHDTVRESARGALVGVGPPAIPALQRLVEGNDPAKAVAAQKLIHAIHQHHGQGQDRQGERGRGLGPGGMGGPWGMGPRGPMNPGGRPERPEPQRPERPAGANPMFERLFSSLKLSEKQQDQVREVMEAQGKKMREFGEKLRGGQVERRELQEAMEKMQKEVLGNLKKVLDEEQFKKLQELLPEGRFPLPGPFGPGGPERKDRGDRERGGEVAPMPRGVDR